MRLGESTFISSDDNIFISCCALGRIEMRLGESTFISSDDNIFISTVLRFVVRSGFWVFVAMYCRLLPISEITPETRGWTAKILVKEKISPRQSKSSPKKYQRYIFIDKDGIEVQAISYSPDMNTVSQRLEPLETYYVTNARVAYVDDKFRVLTENKYQWIISKSTVVCRTTDDALPRELGAPSFIRLSDIPQHLGVDSRINVLGIVINYLQTKTISIKYGPATIQDFVIVDDDATPTLLTLWNEVLFSEGTAIIDAVEKMPVIGGTRLNVTEYHGISLSAKGSSGIILNPLYPDAQRFKTWRAKNQVIIAKLLEEKKYFEKSINPLVVANRSYSTLVAIIMANSEGIFWTKAVAKIVDESQQFWCMACQNCLKRTDALYHMDICYNYCLAQSIAVPRTKFSMILVDETTTLEVVVFGEAAEKLFQKNAIEVMHYIEKGKLDCNAINSSLEGRRFNFQVKKKCQQFSYGSDH